MTHEAKAFQAKMYDLQERTAVFGEKVISLMKILPESSVSRPLIHQLIRSSTSVGANYIEADGAESKKDFRHKIGIYRKKAKESMHWFRMIIVACPSYEDECRTLWNEAQELSLIFSTIFQKCTSS